MYARNVTCYITFRLRGVSIISMDTWSVLVYTFTCIYENSTFLVYPSGREMFPSSFSNAIEISKYKISNRIFVSTLLLVLSNNFNSPFSSREGEKKIPTIFDSFFLLSIDICKPNLTFLKIRIGVYEYVEEYKISEAKQCWVV